MSRTHEAFLPRPNIGPSLQEIFHNEHVGNDSLIVPKRQATDRGKQRTSQGVLVLQQSGSARRAIPIGVRVRIRGGMPGIRSRGSKVQTSAIRNRPDAVVLLRARTRRRVDDMAVWIFSTKRNVVLRAGVVAHDYKTRAKNRGRGEWKAEVILGLNVSSDTGVG